MEHLQQLGFYNNFESGSRPLYDQTTFHVNRPISPDRDCSVPLLFPEIPSTEESVLFTKEQCRPATDQPMSLPFQLPVRTKLPSWRMAFGDSPHIPTPGAPKPRLHNLPTPSQNRRLLPLPTTSVLGRIQAGRLSPPSRDQEIEAKASPLALRTVLPLPVIESPDRLVDSDERRCRADTIGLDEKMPFKGLFTEDHILPHFQWQRLPRRPQSQSQSPTQNKYALSPILAADDTWKPTPDLPGRPDQDFTLATSQKPFLHLSRDRRYGGSLMWPLNNGSYFEDASTFDPFSDDDDDGDGDDEEDADDDATFYTPPQSPVGVYRPPSSPEEQGLVQPVYPDNEESEVAAVIDAYLDGQQHTSPDPSPLPTVSSQPGLFDDFPVCEMSIAMGLHDKPLS